MKVCFIGGTGTISSAITRALIKKGEVVMAYPNPTSGLVSLSDYDGDVIVCDLQGKKVMHGEGESIDLSPLPEGIYLLKLNNGVVVKVMKK